MPSGALACLGVVLGAYLAVLVLSYYWYVTQVLPRLHKALQDLFGESYHRRGCPARVWRLIDACGPEARQRRRDIRARAAALKQLRSETAEADTAKAASCQALAPAGLNSIFSMIPRYLSLTAPPSAFLATNVS